MPDLGKINHHWSQTFVYAEKNIAHHLKGGSQPDDMDRDKLREIKYKYTDWMWSQLFD